MNVLVKLAVFYSDGEKVIELALVLVPALFGISAFISLVKTPLIPG
jgi:hypothetical protein